MTSPSKRPYVGIAAVKTVEHMWACLQRSPFTADSPQVLALGQQVSRKSLFGQPHKHLLLNPSPGDIIRVGYQLQDYLGTAEGAWVPAERHFHYFSDSPPHQQLAEVELLIKLATQSGCADGLQLNLTWPDPRLWQLWQAAFPDSRLIQSITANAVQQAEGLPQTIVDQLRPYQHLITDVFFDVSGGRGQSLDDQQALLILQAVQQAYPHLSLAVAGGLGPNRLQAVGRLLNQLGPLSWDAQSRLYHADREELNVDTAALFLQQSHQLYQHAIR